MKKIFFSTFIIFILVSCVSKKQYLAKEQEVSILKKQLDSIQINGLSDSDKDGIIDKYDLCPSITGTIPAIGCPDNDGDGIADNIDQCPTIAGPVQNYGCPFLDSDRDDVLDKDDDCPTIAGPSTNRGCPVLTSDYQIAEYAVYFQRLRPTRSIKLNKYFKKNITLKECNNQLTNVLEQKLKIADGNYKYFPINSNSYGIITKKECIKENGSSTEKQICTPTNNCKMFNVFCVEEQYSRFYLILVTTKMLGEKSPGFTEEEFKKIYETDELDSNWNSVPEIKQLLSKSNNKLTNEYSIIIKLFEIKKEGTMGDAEVLSDPTYDFATHVDNYFKTTK